MADANETAAESGQGILRPTPATAAVIVALSAVLLAGGWLRFRGLGASCLWLDEVLTAETAVRGPAFIREHRAATFLAFFFEWLAMQGGSGEFWVRLPSALFGTLSIVAIALVTFQISGNRVAAILAAILLAFSDHHLYYSREARSYALLMFLSLLTFLLLLRALLRRKVLWWIAFAAIAVLGLYTSYLFTLILGCLGLYAAAWLVFEYRRREASGRETLVRLAWLLGSGFVAGVLYLPTMVPALLVADAETQQLWAGRQGVADLIAAAAKAWLPFSPWAYPAAAFFIVIGGVLDRRRPRGFGVALLALMIGVHIAFFHFRLIKHFLHVRYVIAVMPFFFVYTAVGLGLIVQFVWECGARVKGQTAERALRWGAVAAATLLVGVYTQKNLKRYGGWALQQKQDWQSVAGFLEKEVQRGDLIVPSIDFTHVCLAHYLPADLRRRSLTPPGSGDAKKLAPLARKGKRIWYVAPHYVFYEVPPLKKWLDTHFTQVFTATGRMPVYVYKGPKVLYP